MKTLFLVAALSCSFSTVVHSATLEMTAGPDLTIGYDPALWKLEEPLRQAVPGVRQSATWSIKRPEWAQITVASHKEAKTYAEYKQEILNTQKFRGDPADLVGERHESLGGRDWMVLTLRNRSTRPTRSEIHYFLSTEEGHVSVFLIGEEATLPKHREAIEAILQKIQVK